MILLISTVYTYFIVIFQEAVHSGLVSGEIID